MRILVVGDTHCNHNFMIWKVFNFAENFGCDAIFVVGDFGFWPNTEIGAKFLSSVSYKATEKNIPVYFLDGNHEDFFTLEDVYGGLSNCKDFISIRKNIFYSPRSHSWEWDGVKFLSLGGAFSVDRNRRVMGQSWFTEETLRLVDIENCLRSQKVDVMLTHDCPSAMDIRSISHVFYRTFAESESNRRNLQKVVDHLQPRMLIHGHYHVRHATQCGNTKIIGLAHDKWQGHASDQFHIIDTKDLR